MRFFLPAVISACLQAGGLSFAHTLYQLVKIGVVSSLGWRHSDMEDWSGRWLPPSSPVNFGQFYHRLINRRNFLSMSLLKQIPDPFCPCFRHTIVVFMAIFLPLWFLFITIGFQITHVWGKGENYFCVLILFSSNTYKGEEGCLLHTSELSLNFVILAYWWKENALSIFCTREMTTSGAEWCQQAPCVGRQPKRPYLTGRVDRDLAGYIWEHVA